MDDTTMKIGLLMEAAQASQKSADSSLKKLKAMAGELGSVVREEVHRTLSQELQTLVTESKRASEALHRVRRAADLRITVWSVAIMTLCSLIPLGLAFWMIPSASEIAALRARHDALVSRINQLEQRGGRIDLRRCGVGGRLCVRVDRRAPIYGEQSDYLIVRGY
jgi:hypothetical protein